MRFGGHETFAIREDWFPKALRILKDNPDLFSDAYASDTLGVGRNMAKSIKHWLTVTGLTTKSQGTSKLALTDICKLILKKDPYLIRVGTWWALHINLVTQETDAITWNWFFSRFFNDRFDRTRCLAELHRQLQRGNINRVPKTETISRDIACLLSSYASSVPPSNADPEEGIDCPFQDLGLLLHLTETDTYQINRKVKKIPSAIVGYAFAVSMQDETNSQYITMPLTQAYSVLNGPCKSLVLDLDSFALTLEQVEKELGSELVHVELSGGERTVRVKQQEPKKWLGQYYRNPD